MTVSIFGLGYVGVVTAACLAERGHRIVGVDLNRQKVELLDAGRSPIAEPGVDDLLAAAHKRGLLSATTAVSAALAAAETALICIGTPSRPNGSLETRFIAAAARTIASALAELERPPVIVLRSTVTPGTTRDLILPLLENGSGKKAGRGFHLAYQPEFLREGNAVYDFTHPAKIVVGADDPEVARKIFSLYEGVPAERFHVDIPTAEMVKYVDNSFHAVKITFANEIGLLCRSLGLDTDAVMEIFRKDTRLNVSEAYLTPGFAFGGSCLPKDLRAVTSLARLRGLETPLLSSVLVSNHVQVLQALTRIVSFGLRRVGIAGLSFKAGTDDVRESPMLEIAEVLAGKGYRLKIYEPAIAADRLLGANREFLLKRLPSFPELSAASLDELLAESELIVIGNNAEEFRGLQARLKQGQRILDCAGAGRASRGAENYEGICW